MTGRLTNLPGPLALRAAEVAAAAQLACLLEASAPKPGNVSPGRHFTDLRYEDFLASAAAIGLPLAEAGLRPLGATVRHAFESTRQWTRTNTNLGIVLLLAPLARAALVDRPEPPEVGLGNTDGVGLQPGNSAQRALDLRGRLRCVLESSTLDDARNVYAAIRCAAPGGLGRVGAEDVADEPTKTLFEVMRLAADRDSIAREYTTAFEITFETGVPALARARTDGLDWSDAIAETFLTLLAAIPDTHIIRRAGADLAAEASQHARAALAAGGVRSASGRRAIDDMDSRLRDPGHAANPGASADLTAAAIFVMLLDGGWQNVHGGPDAAPR
jgi:triphosphoribosyl-dephospho-CoA synthase